MTTIELYQHITDRCKRINDVDMQKLSKMKKTILDYRSVFVDGYRFFDILNMIKNEIKERSTSRFYDDLVISCDEEVNGYKLFDACEPIVDEDDFKEYMDMWNNTKAYSTYDEFYASYCVHACDAWAQQDRNGEMFNGYWKSPNPKEKNNAYEDNCKGLWELPYPKSFVMHTISIGYSNQMESVRFSNFLCEWTKRKLYQMKQPRRLEDTCIKYIKANIGIMLRFLASTTLPKELEEKLNLPQLEISFIELEKIDY